MNAKSVKLSYALSQFTGTENYYRLLTSFNVTDGVKFLMDEANCYWLGHLYGLHLIDIDFNQQPFTVLYLRRVGEGARIDIENGNGLLLSWQAIDYTDFPLQTITLYAQWADKHWIGMLPSEY